jgi:hypothetical protein
MTGYRLWECWPDSAKNYGKVYETHLPKIVILAMAELYKERPNLVESSAKGFDHNDYQKGRILYSVY